jgi:hypothetical protein
MKRSDALASICNKLFEYSNQPISEGMAEDFLVYIENGIGMRPPELDEDKCQALIHIYYGGFTYNQWDEDFEKDEKAYAHYLKRLQWKSEP